MAKFDDAKSIISQLPPELAGLVGRLERNIETGDDLRYLLKLDPSGITARNALKDETGLDLKIDNVLNILDSEISDIKSQYAKYKDLVDLNMIHATMRMFLDKKIGMDFQVTKRPSPSKLEDFEKVLVTTDNLFDLAVTHEDYEMTRVLLRFIASGKFSEENKENYIVERSYRLHRPLNNNSRNIGGKGLLWWIDNGNAKQKEFVLDHFNFFLFNDLAKLIPVTPELTEKLNNIVQKLIDHNLMDTALRVALNMMVYHIESSYLMETFKIFGASGKQSLE